MKNTVLDPIYQTMIGFENMLNRATSSYPPYNLYKDEDCYVIEIAVSGWDKSELDVSLTGTTLTVKGTKEQEEDNRVYLVRGLAHRSWTKTWTLEPDIAVSHVQLEDGILYIELQTYPKSPTRKIDIN
jgi:molecular chaperone IbpA